MSGERDGCERQARGGRERERGPPVSARVRCCHARADAPPAGVFPNPLQLHHQHRPSVVPRATRTSRPTRLLARVDASTAVAARAATPRRPPRHPLTAGPPARLAARRLGFSCRRWPHRKQAYVSQPPVPSRRAEAQTPAEQRHATDNPRLPSHAPHSTTTAHAPLLASWLQPEQPTDRISNGRATSSDSTTRPNQSTAAARRTADRAAMSPAPLAAAARGLPRLPSALVQQRTLRHHQLDAIRRQHTLLHREALLVLPTLDLEDVALELVANVLAIHLSRQTLVVQRAPAKRRAIGSDGWARGSCSARPGVACVEAELGPGL